MKDKFRKFIKEYPVTTGAIVLGALFALCTFGWPYFSNTINIALCYLTNSYIYSDSTNINFSLGEAIAALGLIFAVMQLLNKGRELTLRIKGGLVKNVWWILATLGLISVFISSIVSQPTNFPSLFWSSLFWEQVGFIFFILSPFSLWILANKHAHIFKPKNAERFYHLLLQTASTGKSDDLEIVTTLLLGNLNELTDAIRLIETSLSYDQELPDDKKYCGYAQELLNVVLSDKQVADYIVTSRIDFLFSFLDLVKEKRLSRRTIEIGFDRLIGELFENPESYFYKQLNYDGLSLYAPIFDTIFGDIFFLNKFSVLKIWNFGERKFDKNTERRVQVFLKALEKSIETSKFENYQACQEIAYMLHELVSYARSIIWFSEKNTDKWETSISHIEFFFGHTFPEKYKEAVEKNTASDFELSATKGEVYRQSLTSSYSLALVEFLGELTKDKDRKLERDRAMSATRNIISISDHESVFDNIRKCFFGFMWDHVKDNVEHGYFPATLRVFIELIYWKNGNLPVWYLEERDKLIRYLYQELAPRIVKGELMANYKDKKEIELLPDNIIFDRESNKFLIVDFDGTKRVLL